MTTRSCIGLLLIASTAMLVCATAAFAQKYPNHSVKMNIAFSAGGTVDTLGRIVAQHLSDTWGESVVVENRAGGGGNIGAIAAAKSPPDGYTLHMGAQSLAVNVSYAPAADFDPTRDLDPIMLVATSQDILIVPPNSPFKTFQDLVSYAKANPMKLTYGTLGSASSGNLAVALLSELTGIRMRQVPYTQSGAITTDIMTGRIDVFMPTTGGHIGNVTSGKERALAVSGKARAKGLPDVPTFEELGVKMPEGSSWYALFAPKGTPKPIIDKINRDMEKVLALPDMKEREVTLGFKLIGGSPEKLRGFLKDEIEKWTKLTQTPYFSGQ